MNIYHDIEPGTKEEMHVIIEVPKGSQNKYEIDKETGIIALDRANYSNAAYPVDYGFIPQTLWDDDDAVDVIVLATFPLAPGILVKVRPVALMKMIDSGDNDYKIIGVPVNDRRWEHVRTMSEINPHTIREIQHFFETYKDLKGEPAAIAIEGFADKEEAEAAFERACKMYRDKA